MKTLLPLIIWLALGNGFYPPPDRPPERGEGRQATTTVTSMNNKKIDLAEQALDIAPEDKPALRALHQLARNMELNEKYALAIEAISLHPISPSLVSVEFVANLGEELSAGRELLSRLSATAKIELAIDLLGGKDEEEEEEEDED